MRLRAPSFAESVFPDGWRVGAVRLRTFTLGHALLLERLSNPFWAPTAEVVPDLGALCLATFICSRPASVAAHTMGGWYARQWMVYHAIRWGSTHADREGELRLYIHAARSTPNVEPANKGDGKAAGASLLHILWQHRRIHMRDTEDQVMDCPLMRAQLDHLAWHEQRGTLTIIGDELSAMEQLVEAAKDNAEWDRQMRAKKPEVPRE
jgi:hypothetical protein